MPSFGDFERRILGYFERGTEIFYNGRNVQVLEADKPTCSQGEPKTDIYVLVTDGNEQEEIKISYKKENADFLENKTNAERAEQLFGSNWRGVIERSTTEIRELFEQRVRIYKEAFRRTEKGAITLGWKFELLNKPGGDLSGMIDLDKQQVYDVYAGTNLSNDKKDAMVNGRIIRNSGVADYILISDSVNSAQDVINQMESIWEYIEKHPYIYFACKALNYRTYKAKYDGNRPLAVQVAWRVEDGKLCSDIVFDSPLEMNGDEMAKRLITCLKSLSIDTTDDIDDDNADMDNVYE
ncbi:hypothetical protein [Anaerostipes faecalis]|uniref:hypothetical protein n=1 Tax=Anaerostipes faecalis TaxID=2738446 RepID=UPI003F0C6D03